MITTLSLTNGNDKLVEIHICVIWIGAKMTFILYIRGIKAISCYYFCNNL